MDFRVIALLTAISIFAVLWFIVLLKGPKTTVTRIYSFHIFNVILWTFGLAMYYHAVNPKEALFWTNVLYLGGSLIAASFLHFSFVFPFGETNLTVLQQAILYTPNIILFYLFFFTPVMVKEVTFVTGVKGFSYGFGHGYSYSYGRDYGHGYGYGYDHGYGFGYGFGFGSNQGYGYGDGDSSH